MIADRAGARDDVVQLRDLLIPEDVVEEGGGGGPDFLGQLGLAGLGGLDPQEGDLGLAGVRRPESGAVERVDRLINPAERFEE